MEINDNIDRSSKESLTFYTNMPTPYQLDFFDQLKLLFDLHVVYFTKRESDRIWDLSVEGNGYRVTTLESAPISKFIKRKIPSFHYSPSIKKVLESDNAHYVIVNGTYWSPNVMLALTRSFNKARIVAYWAEPVFPVSNPIKRLLKKTLLGPVLHKTDCLLAIGKKAEQSFVDYGYKKQIFQIPYNINIDLFKKENLDKKVLARLVEQYQLADHHVFLTSGSLINRKGVDVLIKAFIQIEDRSRLKLLIIGDGTERSRLQKLAENQPNIIFLGFQEKAMIPYWFNVAHSFIFASRYDGWGLVINEALAAHLSIVCTINTGAAYHALTPENSILLNSEDVKGFSDAMQQISTRPQMQAKLVADSAHIAWELSSEYNAKRFYDIARNFK